MTKFRLSQSSIDNMIDVHPDLIQVVKLAINKTKYDFGINHSSVRTMDQQAFLVNTGKSKTMKTRHVPDNNECGMSCAIDFNVYVNGKITWDIKYFRKVAQAFVTAAIELGIDIELGCLWESFIDGPHVQLSKRLYP
jgi:peptidoglycan L-alanyl-D-glutamate endopeptidase CwlK